MNTIRAPWPVEMDVRIIRHHHGWLDGSVEGKIIERGQRTSGSWHYVVLGEDGYKYEIDHTRDLRPVRL